MQQLVERGPFPSQDLSTSLATAAKRAADSDDVAGSSWVGLDGDDGRVGADRLGADQMLAERLDIGGATGSHDIS
jgi:hypothetical protein